jgi:hypothetical protein
MRRQLEVREVKKAAPGTFKGLEEARIRRVLAESPPTKRLTAQMVLNSKRLR